MKKILLAAGMILVPILVIVFSLSLNMWLGGMISDPLLIMLGAGFILLLLIVVGAVSKKKALGKMLKWT